MTILECLTQVQPDSVSTLADPGVVIKYWSKSPDAWESPSDFGFIFSQSGIAKTATAPKMAITVSAHRRRIDIEDATEREIVRQGAYTNSTTSGLLDLKFINSLLPHAWFDEAVRLSNAGEISKALDAVYNRLDDWFLEGKFRECDEFLANVKVESTPSRLLLAILTVTFHAVDELDKDVREKFFDRAWQKMESDGKDVQKLLGRLRATHGVPRTSARYGSRSTQEIGQLGRNCSLL